MNGRARDREMTGAVWCVMAWTLAVILTASPASADVWFLGIGNDGYDRDVVGIENAIRRLPNPHHTPIHSRLLVDRRGSDILSDINWLVGSADAGDLAVFFYSGHGDWEYDFSGEELAGWALDECDETIGLLGYDWCTDDELAAALGRVDPGAILLAVFDSCWSGGIVGGTADLNRLSNVFAMMSSREDQPSHGGDPYSVFTEELIRGLGPGFPADWDGDGTVLLSEWFNESWLWIWEQDPTCFDAGNYGQLPITPLPPISGDATGDGVVNGGDYTIWADNYGSSPVPQWFVGGWTVGNFTDDVIVNGADYTQWADNYGRDTQGLAIPEPATLSLLALGGCAGLLRRWHRHGRG